MDHKENLSNSPHKQQALINKAMNEINNQHFSKAETELEKVAEVTPQGWQPITESNDSIYCAFWDTIEMKNFTKEYPQKTIIPIFPSYSHVYFLLGFLAIEVGDGPKALSQLNKALDLQPDHPSILLEKGAILSQMKQFDEAYNCFVLAEKPHYASTPFILARALRGQGITLIDLNRLDEAMVCLNNSLKYDPKSNIALNEIEYIRRLRSGQANPGVDIKINKVKSK